MNRVCSEAGKRYNSAKFAASLSRSNICLRLSWNILIPSNAAKTQYEHLSIARWENGTMDPAFMHCSFWELLEISSWRDWETD